jgi:hypothetical protein
MPDLRSKQSVANEWSLLLEEARQALATLRAGDLEELAARADCMLAATVGWDGIRQRIERPSRSELTELGTMQRRLGDLLAATQRNLKVLRSTRAEGCGADGRASAARGSDARSSGRPGEEQTRWVR